MTTPITLQKSDALRQVAGPIVVKIEPGQTRPFSWGLSTDKDELNAVNISAVGIGAEYLSYPKRVELPPGETISVKGNISIPFDHPGGMELNATMRASEPGKRGETSGETNGGTGVVNVEMSKLLSIVIDDNPFPEFRELIFKPYVEKAKVANEEFSIPIESTSNITQFSFNQNNRSITFNATGYAGTNGTTIIYPAKLLEAPYFLTFDGKAFTEFETVTSNKTGEKSIKVTYPHDSMHDNFALAGSRILVP